MRAVVLAVLMVAGLVTTASADAVLVGHVTDLLGNPVSGARVHVLGAGSEEQVVTTDKDGNYRVVVDGNQEIQVVIGAGNLHTFRRGTIKDGTIKRLDLEVEIAEGEVVRIIDQKPPTVPPKLPKDTPRVTPPYSDEAVVRDAWAKAWLVLDIDEKGKVVRVKLVKRPGFDLNEIAVREAMKLKFEPALDEHGKPMRTMIFWAMEWPSHGWLIQHNGTATRMPTESYAIDPFQGNFGGLMPAIHEASALARVPCAGSGPLNLDLLYPVYRDCSRPNLKKVPYLPWLDGTMPIPPEPPEFAPKAELAIHLSRASYIPQIAASTVTAGLIAAWVATYVQFNKYSNRVARTSAFNSPIVYDLEAYRRDRYEYNRWQKITVVTAIAAIASGGFTTSLWFRHQRKSDFSVQPEDDGTGASVTYSRSF
jgi:hypothetical protein